MTPEEIKKLLLQSKTEGLSGATVADLQRQTADPMWRPKTAKAAHKNELAKQAVTGLQATMGPAAMLMPSMGLMAEAAPTAIGLGAELGDVAQKGFVSNSNFDNTMLAMLGVSGVPLLGKKGEGKLYSKAVTLADEQGVNLHSMTPTFLSRWLKKNNIKPAEAKIVRESNTLYSDKEKTSFDKATPGTVGDVPNRFIIEDLNESLEGKLHSRGPDEVLGLENRPSTKYSDITFPNIISELQNQNINIKNNPKGFKVNNVLIDPQYDTGGKQYVDHWEGQGPIHARVGYGPTLDKDKMIGILAEVQSDAAKKIDSSELPKTTFLSDYPNIATKQGLLQLIQQSDANMTGKPLQVVWPSGELQRNVNLSSSTAYDNIYDKRVTKAISEALGNDAVIEQLRQAPFTPIRSKWDSATKTDRIEPVITPNLFSQDEKTKLQADANFVAETLFDKEEALRKNAWVASDTIQQNLAHDAFFSFRNNILWMLEEHLAKQKAGTVKENPSTLFSTTIPAEKVSRLAKEGIPLWMLPIGMGISSQMSYNKESPQQ